MTNHTFKFAPTLLNGDRVSWEAHIFNGRGEKVHTVPLEVGRNMTVAERARAKVYLDGFCHALDLTK